MHCQSTNDKWRIHRADVHGWSWLVVITKWYYYTARVCNSEYIAKRRRSTNGRSKKSTFGKLQLISNRGVGSELSGLCGVVPWKHLHTEQCMCKGSWVAEQVARRWVITFGDRGGGGRIAGKKVQKVNGWAIKLKFRSHYGDKSNIIACGISCSWSKQIHQLVFWRTVRVTGLEEEEDFKMFRKL